MAAWWPSCFSDHYEFHLGPTRDQDEYTFSGFRGVARRTKKLTDGVTDGR